MCKYVGAGLALADIYGAEQEYAWNVDMQDKKYELKQQDAAQKAKIAGKQAASKMLQAKLEAEREKEKLGEKQLDLIIKQMQEESSADAEAFAMGKKGQSVENTKRQLTQANLRDMQKVKGELDDIRIYLSQQISDTTTEWKYNLDSLDMALKQAKLEKEEAIGDYNMVRAGHVLSILQGYITDKQLGDDWKVDEWFKGKPSPTPQQDAIARRRPVSRQKNKTQLRLNSGRQNDPLFRLRSGKY